MVNKTKPDSALLRILIAVFCIAVLLGSISSASAAQLWDLLVTAKVQKEQIGVNERPVVFGTVLNQIMKPVANADIRISFASTTVNTKTDSDGNFRYEFGNQTTPGLFSVNVYAKSGNDIGIAKTNLRIGDERPSFDEFYYYKSDEFFGNKTASDAHAILMQKQYEKFLKEQEKKKLKQMDIEAKKLELEKMQLLAQQSRDKKLVERQIGPGVLTDAMYARYIEKIDPKAKDTISAQLNYTKQLYADAQAAMKSVLDKGGSLQDAKKAYFEKLTVKKDQLDDLNNTENHSKIKTNEDRKINSKKVKGLKANMNLK